MVWLSCKFTSFSRVLSAVLLLGVWLPAPVMSADYQLYQWCVTHWVDAAPSKPLGPFEGMTRLSKVVQCHIYISEPGDDGAGSGAGTGGADTIPGGISPSSGLADLSCDDLAKRQSQLQAMLVELKKAQQEQEDALLIATKAANDARDYEIAAEVAAVKSRESCVAAQRAFQSAVTGEMRAECKRKARDEVGDCLDALLETLKDGRLGAAMTTSCARSESDTAILAAAKSYTDALQDTADTILDDFRDTVRQIEDLRTAISRTAKARKTCEP